MLPLATHPGLKALTAVAGAAERSVHADCVDAAAAAAGAAGQLPLLARTALVSLLATLGATGVLAGLLCGGLDAGERKRLGLAALPRVLRGEGGGTLAHAVKLALEGEGVASALL